MLVYFLVSAPSQFRTRLFSSSGDSRSGWMMNRVRDGHKFYFNANKMEYSWEKTEVMKKDYSLLTRDEIQVRFLKSDLRFFVESFGQFATLVYFN